MKLPAATKITALAIGGLVVAALLGLAASRVTSQRVGISAESVSIGEELVNHDSRRSRPTTGGQAEVPAAPTSGLQAPASTTTIEAGPDSGADVSGDTSGSSGPGEQGIRPQGGGGEVPEGGGDEPEYEAEDEDDD